MEIEKEENLVKRTCKELGITQKELAEKIGVSNSTIFRWISKDIDKTTKVILNGLLCQKKLKDLQIIFHEKI